MFLHKKMKDKLNNIWSFTVKYKYIITIVFFVVWIIFLDQTSLIFKSELNKEIDFLRKRKEYYEDEIKKNETYFKDLQTNPKTKERLAREEYYMSKDNEVVFIIKDESEE